MNTYEGLFIFPGNLKDDALESAVEKAKAEITKLSGEVRSTTRLGRRPFARSLKGHESGQYFLITFVLDPGNVAVLNARYKLVDEVFRTQFVRVDAKQTEQEQEQEPASAPEPEAQKQASPASSGGGKA